MNNKNFIFLPGTKEDIEELLDLYNQYWQILIGVIKFTLEDFNNIFSTPGFVMENSINVVKTKEGDIIGSVMVSDLDNPPIHPSMYGCVREGYERQGIGTYLINWGEKRARQAIERCPPNARVSMYIEAAPSHEPTVQLLMKFDFSPVRYSWIMIKELVEHIPEAQFPSGIQIKSFEDNFDLETVIESVDEIFEDHWGYIDRSGDDERMNRVRYSIENEPDFDPSLWIIAVDGDEIAGVALCSPKFGIDLETGWVDTLGVRRQWRRQGLGLGLLHHAFTVFNGRGYKRVGLGVDTQSLTGATGLYEKAGMFVYKKMGLYEKELRPGIELRKQS